MDERHASHNEFYNANNKWHNSQQGYKPWKKTQYDEMKLQEAAEKYASYKTIEEEDVKKVPYEEEKSNYVYLVKKLTETYLDTDK